MDEQRLKKRNMIMYPLGTVGRDMVYCLVTNFLLTYILFTKGLTSAQLGAVTAIMVMARVFDALNDPVMGNIIENTRSRWGKFKPWLLVGMLLTSFVVYMVFGTKLRGWNFIALFAVFYFSFSIAYTMHDISYWGMVPALGSDAGTRDQLTSRATLFAGIGGTIASILIPMLTTGEKTIGGNAGTAYSVIALAVGILAPLFVCFTLFGVREHREDAPKKEFSLGLGKVISTIRGNDQLMWISLIFLIQQVGNGLVVGGIGSTYIYLTYGYSGGLYSTFSTIGMMATAVLMVFYPAISRKIHRKKLMSIIMTMSIVGYILMLVSGFLMNGSGQRFNVLTLGYMLSNFGQYGFYLVMMISIINTVEYNEYKHGTREEAIIASIRPFFTKMGSALVVVITSVSYMAFGITNYTNQISDLESAAASGLITEAEKLASIEGVIAGIQGNQSSGLLLCMVVIPFVMMFVSYLLYRKHYILDEEEYDRICRVIAERKQSV